MSGFFIAVFILLWASAPTATKFGLPEAAPLTLATIRFLMAGPLLLLLLALRQQFVWPKGKDWWRLMILGLLNTTIYLGGTFLALESISPGLFTLIIATGPLWVVLFSKIFLGRSLQMREVLGFLLSFLGVAVAVGPHLLSGSSSSIGLIESILAVMATSLGTVYYKKSPPTVSGPLVNGWQVFLGGLLLAPIAYLFNGKEAVTWNLSLVLSLLWLIIAVSMIAMLLWYKLLILDPVVASRYLFLTPIAGYLIAFLVLGTPLTYWALAGTIFVMGGLRVAIP